MENIVKINPTGYIPDRNRGFAKKQQQKKQKKKQRRSTEETLEDLQRVAKEADEALVEAGSPFRIRLYDENGEVYINVVTLGPGGRVDQVFHQDITRDDLEGLVTHITSGRGLVFDAKA